MTSRILALLCIAACTGKDDCPEGTYRNAAGLCDTIGGSESDADPDTDTDTDTDTGDTGDSGPAYDVCAKDAPYAVIQEAIDAASAGDTVTICPEIFYETLTLDKAITLTGPAEGATTRIDARGDGIVLSVSAGAAGATLANLVLRNGDASPSRGGYGGGLLLDGATVTATNLQIEDGIASVAGGGVAVLGNDSVFTDLTVVSGRAEDFGGGVYISGGAPVFRRLLVQESFAARGAGLYALSSAARITGAIFYRNDAQEAASGLLVEDGNDMLVANAVFGIGTGGEGGCAVDTTDGATLTSSAAFNNEGIGLCTDSSSGYNLSYANTVSEFRVGGVDGPGDTDLTSDPFFKDPNSGDYAIRENSPAVDAGNPDVDYNDADGSRGDIGAYGGPYGFVEE